MTAGLPVRVLPDSVAVYSNVQAGDVENACAGVHLYVYPAGRAHKSVHTQKSVTDEHNCRAP